MHLKESEQSILKQCFKHESHCYFFQIKLYRMVALRKDHKIFYSKYSILTYSLQRSTVSSINHKISKSSNLLGGVTVTTQTIIPYKKVAIVKCKSNIEFETRKQFALLQPSQTLKMKPESKETFKTIWKAKYLLQLQTYLIEDVLQKGCSFGKNSQHIYLAIPNPTLEKPSIQEIMKK